MPRFTALHGQKFNGANLLGIPALKRPLHPRLDTPIRSYFIYRHDATNVRLQLEKSVFQERSDEVREAAAAGDKQKAGAFRRPEPQRNTVDVSIASRLKRHHARLTSGVRHHYRVCTQPRV